MSEEALTAFRRFLLQNEAWRDRAACRNMGPDLFFQKRGQPTNAAKSVCQTCPVRAECADYSDRTHSEFGMWGGIQKKRISNEDSVPEQRPQ